MKNILITTTIFVAFIAIGCSLPTDSKVELATAPNLTSQAKANITTSENLHEPFQMLLRRNVKAGKVNYKAFKAEEDKLDAYLATLASSRPDDSDVSKEAKAYWLNAYNAFTIKLILKSYPVKSIKEIANGQPWKLSWIKLGDSSYSLDQIENAIIRPRFKDARIHFAVNCAAVSCPPLANTAFTADNVESQLGILTRNFLLDSDFNELKSSYGKISKIFDWYKEDFGNLVDFINRYTKVNMVSGAKIEYQAYDWSLNE